MGAEAAAAVVAAKQRRIVEAFQREGATSPESARPLGELGLTEGRFERRLMSRGILRQTEPGAYYLDEPTWDAYGRSRRRNAAIVGIVVILAFLLYVLLQTSGR